MLQWMTQVKGGGEGGGRCFKDEVLCCNGCLKGGEGRGGGGEGRRRGGEEEGRGGEGRGGEGRGGEGRRRGGEGRGGEGRGGEGELKADIAGCIPIDTMSPGRSSSLDIFSHFPPLCTCGVV